MKLIITENRLKSSVLKYLNNIDWSVLESTNELYPFEVFEHRSDDTPTFIIHCTTHKFGESCVLMIKYEFLQRLQGIFGPKSVGEGPDDEPNTLLMEWFNEYFNMVEVIDYMYIDEYHMSRHINNYNNNY